MDASVNNAAGGAIAFLAASVRRNILTALMGSSTSKAGPDETKPSAPKAEPGVMPEAGATPEATATTSPETEKKQTEKKQVFVVEKQNPSSPWWKKRFFLVDLTRGALVYYADPEARVHFKGAIPLSLVSNVSSSRDMLVLEIPGRRFVLRPPRGADDANLKALSTALLEALAMEPEEADSKGAVDYPRGHWKQQARYTSRPLREEGNVHSRSQHPGYPARAKLLSGTQSWDVALPTYAPPTYTAAGVTVQPAAEGCMSWTGKMKYEGGKPLNPSGRTGLAGQGELLRSGPNQEVRVVVTKEVPAVAAEPAPCTEGWAYDTRWRQLVRSTPFAMVKRLDRASRESARPTRRRTPASSTWSPCARPARTSGPYRVACSRRPPRARSHRLPRR